MTGKDSNYIAKCSLPFFAMLVLCLAIITAFPETATWFPDLVMGK
jgi:TRAP-type C4-dicarboxylate transport system permease large subunit